MLKTHIVLILMSENYPYSGHWCDLLLRFYRSDEFMVIFILDQESVLSNLIIFRYIQC